MDSETGNQLLLLFGQRIRDRRRVLGLTQEQLAFRAVLDRSYVGGVERGERNIAAVNMHRLAVALETTVSSLWEGLDEKIRSRNGD